MRNTALASTGERDEIPVNIEALETNVVAMRADLNELKTDFKTAVARLDNDIKAAVARLDSDIKAAVAKLEAEIRARAEKAERDLKDYADRVERQFADMRQDMREMRAENNARMDATHARIDATNARLDTTNEKLGELDRKVTHIGSKLNALLWMISGLGALITIALGAATAVYNFQGREGKLTSSQQSESPNALLSSAPATGNPKR